MFLFQVFNISNSLPSSFKIAILYLYIPKTNSKATYYARAT